MARGGNCAAVDCVSIAADTRRETPGPGRDDRRTMELGIQQYERLIQSLPNGLVLVGTNGMIVHVNAQLEKMFGYTREELIGKELEILMPPRYRARHRQHYAEYVAGPRIRPMGSGVELFGLKKDGTEVPVDISLSYLTTAGGMVSLAIIKDITDRKSVEHQLELNYRIQEAVSSVLKISLEPVSLEEQLSRALDLILSIPSFEMRSRGSIHLVGQEPGNLVLKAMRGFSVAQVESCKTVSLKRDGAAGQTAGCSIVATDCLEEPHDIHYSFLGSSSQYCVPITVGERVLGLINVAVTDEHQRTPEEDEFLMAIANSLAGLIDRHQAQAEKGRLREQIVESEKFAALGRMTANVSHTIKNPLAVIGGFANRLMDKLPEGTKEKKYAGLIFSESIRLENVLQNILLFSRPDADRRLEFQVSEVLDRALMMYEDICRERSIAITRNGGDVRLLVGNKEQVRQAVENLLSNAIDAMPGGGALTVTTGEESVGGAPYFTVKVKDTGPGIEAETITRIFEPFFTTKLAIKGTGLGLSIAKKVVEEHGGFIRVESEVGAGSTFSLFFPLHKS